jgi:hypothetical protein
MEDSKLQALHDALSQLRGQKGLGTNSQYSWQRGTSASTTRHPAAAKLPNNALYANFLPEGVYDPNTAQTNDGDGRVIKREFSDAIENESGNSLADVSRTSEGSSEKAQQKAVRKAAKKEAKKAAKLKAKIEEKKRQKKLARKLLKSQSSGVSEITLTSASIDEAKEMQLYRPSAAKVNSSITADSNAIENSGSGKKRDKSLKDGYAANESSLKILSKKSKKEKSIRKEKS